MEFIKSAARLSGILSQHDLDKIEKRAELHRRFSSIDFKILEASDDKIVVRVTQGKSHNGNYFENKRLSEIGKELFDEVELPAGIVIHARPIPYAETPTEVVTPAWLKSKFEETGTSLVKAGKDLGIDPNTLSAFRSGIKPISGVAKAALYYYFCARP